VYNEKDYIYILIRRGVFALTKMKRMAALTCVLCLLLSLTGCGKLQISREIAKVNGRIVTKAEYMYYLEKNLNVDLKSLSKKNQLKFISKMQLMKL